MKSTISEKKNPNPFAQIGDEDWFDKHVVVLSDNAGQHGPLHHKIKDMVYEKQRQHDFKEWVWVTLEEHCEEIRTLEQLRAYVREEYEYWLLSKLGDKFIDETTGYAFQVHEERMLDFMNDQRDD